MILDGAFLISRVLVKSLALKVKFTDNLIHAIHAWNLPIFYMGELHREIEVVKIVSNELLLIKGGHGFGNFYVKKSYIDVLVPTVLTEIMTGISGYWTPYEIIIDL